MAGLKRHRVVIAYDISSNRRRRRVRHVLVQWRLGGQKSVHECWMSRADARTLFVELCEVIDPMEDRILLAFIRRSIQAPRDLRATFGLVYDDRTTRNGI